MKTYWGSGSIAPLFLASVLDRGEWSALHPGRFTPEERAHGTHRIGGWVSPGAGLGVMESCTAGKVTAAGQPITRHYTD
jgi:hypothetical protein